MRGDKIDVCLASGCVLLVARILTLACQASVQLIRLGEANFVRKLQSRMVALGGIQCDPVSYNVCCCIGGGSTPTPTPTLSPGAPTSTPSGDCPAPPYWCNSECPSPCWDTGRGGCTPSDYKCCKCPNYGYSYEVHFTLSICKIPIWKYRNTGRFSLRYGLPLGHDG